MLRKNIKRNHLKCSIYTKKAEILANIGDINILIITINVNGANIIKSYNLSD